MKRGGVFQRMAIALGFIATVNFNRTNHYPDPVFDNRGFRHGNSRGQSGRKIGKPRYGRPPCIPGTITFHDKLVRHYGRRVADEIGRRFIAGENNAIPRMA